MTTSFNNSIMIVAAILTGLISGLFYAYSCSVNPGLSKLDDLQYISAMKSINSEIINPLFMLSFIGTFLLLPFAAYRFYNTIDVDRFYLLLTASVVYLTGVMGVTMFGNVPLNEMLAKVDVAASSINELAHFRKLFEEPWNKLHRIRTIASVIAFTCTIMACVFDKEQLRTLFR